MMVNEEASGMKSSCIPLKFNVCAFNYQFFEENPESPSHEKLNQAAK
jgi:hypothetical protein